MNSIEINKLAELSGYAYIGIRAMTGGEVVGEGDELSKSFVWIDGERTNERLEGTCAVNCGFDGFDSLDRLSEALKIVKAYDGQVVLVGTNTETYEGNDVGEIVMPNAVVIAVINE
jgi:hypothetical protein